MRVYSKTVSFDLGQTFKASRNHKHSRLYIFYSFARIMRVSGASASVKKIVACHFFILLHILIIINTIWHSNNIINIIMMCVCHDLVYLSKCVMRITYYTYSTLQWWTLAFSPKLDTCINIVPTWINNIWLLRVHFSATTEHWIKYNLFFKSIHLC